MGGERRRPAYYWASVIIGVPIFILFAPFLIVGLPLYGLYRWVKGAILKAQFRKTWGRRGKMGVFVYSDSPNWKEYIETNILPQLHDRLVTINWSERAAWQKSPTLESRLFWHWAGSREFNPMAILVPASGAVRTVRFWQAFRDYKHGKAGSLEQRKSELFAFMEGAA